MLKGSLSCAVHRFNQSVSLFLAIINDKSACCRSQRSSCKLLLLCWSQQVSGFLSNGGNAHGWRVKPIFQTWSTSIHLSLVPPLGSNYLWGLELEHSSLLIGWAPCHSCEWLHPLVGEKSPRQKSESHFSPRFRRLSTSRILFLRLLSVKGWRQRRSS